MEDCDGENDAVHSLVIANLNAADDIDPENYSTGIRELCAGPQTEATSYTINTIKYSDSSFGQATVQEEDANLQSHSVLHAEDGEATIPNNVLNNGSLFLLQTELQSSGEVLGTPVLVYTSGESGSYESNVIFDGDTLSKLIRLNPSTSIEDGYLLQSEEKPEDVLEPSLPPTSLNEDAKTPGHYTCKTAGCGRQFDRLDLLRHHQLHIEQCDLKCSFEGCNRRFTWPAHFKYHQLSHVNNRQHVCHHEGCSSAFITAQQLAVHVRTHTGERPYMCEKSDCGKSFTTIGNLRNHMRIHTGERPYMCDFAGCSKRFSEYSTLKKHSLVHSGVKPYLCSVCGQSYSQSGSRNVHMRRMHPGSMPPAKSSSASAVSSTDSIGQPATSPPAQVPIESCLIAGESEHPENMTTELIQAQGSGETLQQQQQKQGEETQNEMIDQSANSVVVLAEPQENQSQSQNQQVALGTIEIFFTPT